MKILFYSILVLIILGCNVESNEETIEENSHDIGESIELADKYIESLINLRYDTLSFMLAPEVIFYGPGISDSSNLAESIILWKSMRDWFDSSTELNIISKKGIYDEENNSDWVFIRGMIDGFHNDYKRNVHVYIFVDFKIVDKKIVQVNICWDGLDLLTQLGYILKAPK